MSKSVRLVPAKDHSRLLCSKLQLQSRKVCRGVAGYVSDVCVRSSDGQLLVISSTDGYCTLITFDENEMGTAYKKADVAAPVSSPVRPVHEPVEHSSEVKAATTSEPIVVQTSSVVKPVSTEGSPQRKKARRVVLQTLSTNVVDFNDVPHETATSEQTGAAKNFVGGEALSPNDKKCQPVVNGGDQDDGLLVSGQIDNNTVCRVSSDDEPESMDVCADLPVAKVRDVRIYFY